MTLTSNTAAQLLRALLALLRAQYWHYQNAHWTVKGGPFYGDHLMFQRIYEGLQKEIDTLAEKAVASFGGEVVEPTSLAALMQGWLRRWSGIDCLHKRSLASEADFQNAVKGVYDAMKAEGTLSLGMDDFLMAIANDHETNTYLVQQTRRASEGSERLAKDHPSEDARRKYLQDHPKADPKRHSVREKGQSKDKPKDAPKDKPKDAPKEGFERLKGMSPEDQRKIIQRALAMGGGETGAKDVSKQEGFERLKNLTPGKQRQVIEKALRMAALEDAWKVAAPHGGWTSEMTSLEKSYGGYSSFRPVRHGDDQEDLHEDGGEQTDLLDDNDDLMASWFKTDNEGYFTPPPQWDQLQDWAQSGETPALDEKPFSGWTLTN